MRKLLVYISTLGLLIPSVSLAHPGRTDSSGCHTCRTNCSKWGLSTGEYHCHRAKALPQPKEPVKSHFSETGGYTTPAPEYKQTATPILKTDTVAKPKVEKTVKIPTVEKAKEMWIIKLFKFLFD